MQLSYLLISSSHKITLNKLIMLKQENTFKKLKMHHLINWKTTLIFLKMREVLMLKNLSVKQVESLSSQNKIPQVSNNSFSRKKLAVQWLMLYKQYKQKIKVKVNILQERVRKESIFLTLLKNKSNKFIKTLNIQNLK